MTALSSMAAFFSALASRLISCLIRGYQLLVSPFLPISCRFHPTCSEYAQDALHTHGLFKGGSMALWRVLRCNPWNRGGLDPVPEAHHSQTKAVSGSCCDGLNQIKGLN